MSVKRIDIAEFRREGYLQEVNRQFLHPLGLALEVAVEKDGTERISGVWDYRDDPEGLHYDGTADSKKAANVAALLAERAPARIAALGFLVEPVKAGDDPSPATRQVPPTINFTLGGVQLTKSVVEQIARRVVHDSARRGGRRLPVREGL